MKKRKKHLEWERKNKTIYHWGPFTYKQTPKKISTRSWMTWMYNREIVTTSWVRYAGSTTAKARCGYLTDPLSTHEVRNSSTNRKEKLDGEP
jgi:hypothetical protein